VLRRRETSQVRRDQPGCDRASSRADPDEAVRNAGYPWHRRPCADANRSARVRVL